MKTQLLTTTALFLLLFSFHGNAQIKIGNNPTTIGASSLLELESSNKGLVFPRMSGVQMNAIPSPVSGMYIYNTDSLCLCHYNGTAWRSICGGNIGSPYNDWHLLGNTGTNAANNFIGTTDGVDFVTRTNGTERMRVLSSGNVGIGLPNPLSTFSVLRSAAAVPATSGTATTAIARFEAQNNALDIGAFPNSPYGNWIQSTAASDLSFKGPIALNPNGGYVGVGTIAPANRFEVVNDGSTYAYDERIALKTYSTGPNPVLVIQSGRGTAASPTNLATGSNLGNIAFVGQVNGSATLLNRISNIYTGTGTTVKSEMNILTSGVEHLRIDSMGRAMLAINTATYAPKTSFHMYGDGTGGFTLQGTTTQPVAASGPEIGFSRGGFTQGVGAAIQFIDYNAYSGGLAFLVHKGTQNNAGGTFADNWPTDVIQAMTIVNNGQIGIGTGDPQTTLQINGGVTITPPSVINLTSDNQAVTVGNYSTINISSNNNTSANRTFTLSTGLTNGQLLYIIYTGAGSTKAELADSGNCKLSGLMTFDADDSISLMWNGSNWIELSRSIN